MKEGKSFEEIISLDPYLGCFDDIASRVQQLGQSERNRLLSMCDRVFSDIALRKDEPTRVAAAKVMTALVPDSADSIRRWINTKSGKYIYEVHFPLFCFLDQLPDLPNGREFAGEIPSLIGEYLLETKSETAHAAFMAGDLLGDHWETKEALPILIKVAKQAKYAAGRHSAIHGLGHVLRKLPDSDSSRETIVSLLRGAYENDRSEDMRITARMLLEKQIL